MAIRVGAKAVIIENESILLIEYNDENGFHYNLPGGGVEPGETVKEAIIRELQEEASLDVEVGSLLFVMEYEPKRNKYWAGGRQAIYLFFECTRKKGPPPQMSKISDINQTGAKWVKLADLNKIELLPHISDLLTNYLKTGKFEPLFLEEPINPTKVEKYLSKLDR